MYKTIRKIIALFFSFLNDHRQELLCVGIVSLIPILQYVQLDYSCVSLEEILTRSIKRHLFNCGVILLPSLVLTMLTRRCHIAFLISSVFFFILSIVNHYVFLYSGEPLLIHSLSELPTVLNVIDSYRFQPDWNVFVSLLLFLCSIALALLLRRLLPSSLSRKRRRAILLVTLLLACAAGVSTLRILSNTYLFSINSNLNDLGYIPSVIEIAFYTSHTVTEPDGYTEQRLREETAALTQPSAGTDVRPDVILILNETFYDLDVYTQTAADTPFLEKWYNREGVCRGYAVSPYACGGTNDSEFELLTSHSSVLLTRRAPFTSMDMTGLNSVAHFLKEIGYSTLAAHGRAAENYRRGKSWPLLGFDETYFYDDLTYHAVYGARVETDAANYADLTELYEQMDEGPRFMYLLTYQNHGGYEQNDSGYDTVHTGRDFGEWTDEVNEYLTCMRMSDDALEELLAYFDSIERPVVVCMVGDHAPYFISELPADEQYSAEEAELRSQLVPYMIWSNKAFGTLNLQENPPAVTMTDLIPELLSAADLPLSPYYQSLLTLADEIPIRLTDGRYIDAEGQTGTLSAADSRFTLLAPCLDMEYADLCGEPDDLHWLFSPSL